MWSAVTPPHPNQTQRPASALCRRGQYLTSFAASLLFQCNLHLKRALSRSALAPTVTLSRSHGPLLIKFSLNLSQMDRVRYSLCYNTDNTALYDQSVSSQSKVEKGQRMRSCDLGTSYSSSEVLTFHLFMGFGSLSRCTIESELLGF